MFCKAKSAKKNFFLRGDFWQFSNKNVQIWDLFFPLLFPKDSESLEILDIRLREVGAKKRLNGTSKVNTQMDIQADISTYRKHRPRGPMLWKETKFPTSWLSSRGYIWACNQKHNFSLVLLFYIYSVIWITKIGNLPLCVSISSFRPEWWTSFVIIIIITTSAFFVLGRLHG